MHEQAVAVDLVAFASCAELLEDLCHSISIDIIVSLGFSALAHEVVPNEEEFFIAFTYV